MTRLAVRDIRGDGYGSVQRGNYSHGYLPFLSFLCYRFHRGSGC